MNAWLKITGLIFILITCTAAGFSKALLIKCQHENLIALKSGILKLKEKIRLHSGNKSNLINECFPAAKLEGLTPNDKQLFNEFIESLGTGDTLQEIERCGAYAALFESRIKDTKSEADEQQKLYKTLGFLSGLFICIFLL